jgi:hypothetical protein
MLTTSYIVLDEFSLLYHEDDKRTAVFERKEDAQEAVNFLIKEKVKEGMKKAVAELSTLVLELRTKK